MTKTVVIYHSGYGHTQRVAQFVAEGAKAQVIAIDADGNITNNGGATALDCNHASNLMSWIGSWGYASGSFHCSCNTAATVLCSCARAAVAMMDRVHGMNT